MLTGYVFTISENTPLDEEVAVDPEILGRIFENLLAEINPETGDTARKKTGSYYTPREIVDYMVTQSLVYSLNEKTGIDEETLRKLMSHDGEDIELSDSQRDSIITALDAIKVLDPACGSGAFPMGILQRILLILQRIDTKSRRWLQLKLNRIENTMLRQEVAERLKNENYDYIHKLGIIQNSIFGIDIQPVAVEISKLRFFLSLIVDEKLDDNKPNRGVEPLPNLEFKFVAANTLISAPDEYDEGEQSIGLEDPFFGKFETLTKDYFSENSPSRKAELREEIETLIHGKAREKYSHINDLSERIRTQHAGSSKRRSSENALKRHSHELRLWQSYPNIFKDAAVEFFDIKYFFPDAKAGFDIVIGNPPYVRQESIKEQKPFLNTSCQDTFTSAADLYVYFYDRGLQFLHDGGILTLISSNKYFRAGYGKLLRKHLVENTSLKEIIDFGDAPVFTAIAYPAIVISRKEETDKTSGNQFKALNWKPGEPIAQFAHVFAEQAFTIAQTEMTADGWRFEQPEVLRLLDKMRNIGIPLGEYVNGRFYRGILTGYNKAFVIDKPTRDRLIEEDPKSAEVIKPFLRGRDVKRWRVNFAEQYLIKIESSENKPHPWSKKSETDAETIFAKTYPAIHNWFQQHRQKLIDRYDQGAYWWELRACKYYDEFEKPKILYPDIYEHQSYCYDEEGHFSVNTTYFIPTNEKWLSAVLNSNSIEWFYGNISNRVRGGYLRAFSDYVKQIPIPPATKQQKAEIESIVNEILTAKAENPNANVSTQETRLNHLIAELFNLTDEEIGTVEGK
jgi:tRNA1(Val) A37 N6-methylase TrmN6